MGGAPEGGRYIPKAGPTNLDVDCQEALRKLLKPCNYPAIVPWMNEASNAEKRDVAMLWKLAAGGGCSSSQPVSWLPVHQERVIVTGRGRPRLAKTMHVTPDCIQSDLLRNSCGSDIKDEALEAKRKLYREWAPVPTVESTGDFHRLKEQPIMTHATAQVLSESAKRALQRWQVDGPDKSPIEAANAMRALRNISEAVARIPKFTKHFGGERRPSDIHGHMHEYSAVAPRGSRTLLHGPYAIADRQLVHSSSAPAMLRPLVGEDELEKIQTPGGYVVNLMDYEPVAKLKNRERNQRSKLSMNGGASDWTTTAAKYGHRCRLKDQPKV